MSVALTSIFGNEISVTPQPARSERQFCHFPGSHGLTSMHLGLTAFSAMITGTLRATGASYAAARATMDAALQTIAAYQLLDADTYTFGGCTYSNALIGAIELIPDATGKGYHWTGAALIAQFRCPLYGLLP